METMKMNDGSSMNHGNMRSKNTTYKKLGIMILVMFVSMYLIMFCMIDSVEHLIPNINNTYMTLLMTTAMVVIELIIMAEMYGNKKWNISILTISVLIAVFSWFGIRKQLYVDDEGFIKGMIPHHAAAVLMSEQSHLTDPELIQLKNDIINAQKKEIQFMKTKLKELEK